MKFWEKKHAPAKDESQDVADQVAAEEWTPADETQESATDESEQLTMPIAEQTDLAEDSQAEEQAQASVPTEDATPIDTVEQDDEPHVSEEDAMLAEGYIAVEPDPQPEETTPVAEEVQPTEEQTEDTTEPVEFPSESQPTPARKPLSAKSKKAIIIGAIAFALVVAIVLSISLPLYFHFKDKIMVKTVEDFANTSKGNHYVLANDVTVDGDLDLSQYGNLSIDLAGHTLTVTGTLTYKSDGTVTALALGNTDRKEYVEGGALKVGKLSIDMPNAKVDLLCNIQADTVAVSAGAILMTGATTNSDIVLQGQTVVLNNNYGVSEQGALILNRCANVMINGTVSAAVQAHASYIETAVGSVCESMTLDVESSAQIRGKINGALQGGSKVAMLPGSSSAMYQDVAVLAVYLADGATLNAVNCDKIVYLETFPMPSDLVVEEHDGRIYAVCGQVNGAKSYEFVVDGETFEQPTNRMDITDLMRQGGAGKHSISARAMGQYDFATIDTYASGSIVYMDGQSIATVYSYSITLQTPSNVKAVTEGDKVFLHFDRVEFADYYEIVIGGTTLRVDSADTEIMQVDITAQVSRVGAYAIRVSAHSKIAEIQSSRQATTSYVRTAQHAAVASDSIVLNDQTLQWGAVDTARTYTVVVTMRDGSTYTLTTTQTSCVLDNADVQSVQITVNACGYYTTSAATTQTF